MKRCLRIIVSGKVQADSYREFVKNNARQLEVEGTVQYLEDGSILIHACGTSESLDCLIDALYAGGQKSSVEEVMAESMGKARDFRGVFRVIGGDS